MPSAGFKFAWDGAKACGSRISSVTVRTGNSIETPVDGGDGYSTLVKGTNRLGGGQDIETLTAYMNANFKAPKPAYTPGTNPADTGTARISRLASTSAVCPSGALTNP